MNEFSKKIEVELVFKHPHNIGIDIKGNFHRGLGIGVIVGYTLALFGVWVLK